MCSYNFSIPFTQQCCTDRGGRHGFNPQHYLIIFVISFISFSAVSLDAPVIAQS